MKKTLSACVCAHCARTFYKPLSPSQLRSNEGKYCSRKCSSLDQRKQVQAGTCERCGGAIKRSATERPGKFARKRFCNFACSRAAERAKHEAQRQGSIKACAFCFKSFVKPTMGQQRLRKCCSVACYRKLQASAKANRLSKLRCVVCGGTATNDRGFSYGGSCSAACGQKLRQAKATTRRDAHCKHCGEAFRAKLNYDGTWGRYCSFACVKAVKSKRLQMRSVLCEACGCEFERTFGAVKRTKRLFCSKDCQHKHMVGEQSAMWRGGSDPNRGAGWVKLAEKIRERDGYCCQRCNRTQEENRQKLSVDHIRPWRLFDSAAEANHPTNLISLCRKCHTWKTSVAERRMLKGDNIQFQQYKRSIELPPLLAMGTK